MSESGLWEKFKGAVGKRGHWFRVENSCGIGTPDVSGLVAGGPTWWLELKYRRRWPVRTDTVVKLDHFTDAQKAWLVRHGKAGGSCGVLLEVAGEYLLFDWRGCVYTGTVPRAVLYELALWRGRSLGDPLFIGFLQRGVQVEGD